MTKKIILGLVILFCLTVVYSRTLPNTVQFHYPMELDPLKISGNFVKISSKEVEKTFEDYTVGINENGLIITCNKVDEECMDKEAFRQILDDMEEEGAYDLSKEQKDTIASLYQPNVIIKEIPKKKLIGVKIKAKVLEFIGQIFCTHYQVVQECTEDWCSLVEHMSEECAGLK
jgi:hypothetical protein